MTEELARLRRTIRRGVIGALVVVGASALGYFTVIEPQREHDAVVNGYACAMLADQGIPDPDC